MSNIYWPEEVLKPQAVSANIVPRNLRGPANSRGFAQVSSNSAGLWSIEFTDIPVVSANAIKAWRSVASIMEGQANPIVVPLLDFSRAPTPSGLTRNSFCANMTVPHSDDTPHDDGSPYAQGWNDIRVAQVANTGAVQISVTKVGSGTLETGQRFSINDRANEIKSIVSQDATSAVIKLVLPLREPIYTYEYLEFDRPRTKVRLASDDEMNLDLAYNRHGFKSVKFIEWL